MSTNEVNSSEARQFSKQEPTSDYALTLKDLKYLFLPRWYWFVLSVIVALGLGVLYLMSKPNIYTRTASILVKNEDGNAPGSVEFMNLSDLTGLQATASIENDVFMLQSPDLMEDVVLKLGLSDIYTVEEGLRTRELYKCHPVVVTPADTLHPKAYAFNIRLNSGDSFELSGFFDQETGEEIEKTINGKLGNIVNTPYGRFILTRAPWKTDDFTGEDISYVHIPSRKMGASYAGALGVAAELKQGSVISMSISDASPKKAEDILLALIDAYNEQWIEDRNRVAVSTSRFISERLAVIESELGHVDSDISSYKAKHLLPDVKEAASLYFSQSATNKETIAKLHDNLSMAEYVKKELLSATLSDPLPTNTGFERGGLETQLTAYNTLVFERNRLLASTSETNPVVQEKAATLKAMQSSLVKSVNNLITSFNTQLSNIRQRESETRAELAAGPGQAKYLLSVERQQKVKEALYVYLLQKREENELTQAFTAYNTRTITRPIGSDFPTSPRRSMVLFIAFILGMAIPAAIIYLREMMNTRVRGRKDLEGLSLTFAGEIPQWGESRRILHALRKGKRSKVELMSNKLLVEQERRDIINEAFRVVRTNIEFIANGIKEDRAKIIAVTSFNPGSGKTFISMNLAMSLALKDAKVLVIDGDLRCASTSRYVDNPKPGLGEWLGGYVENAADIIVEKAECANLHVLPVGTMPPNPTELLENGRLGELLESVKQHYDYIFIDCPPVELVADSQIISRYIDRTVFVVRAGLMERAMLEELERLYVDQKYPGMCILLNGTEGGTGSYGYRYGYHYGYNYSYGHTGYYGK